MAVREAVTFSSGLLGRVTNSSMGTNVAAVGGAAAVGFIGGFIRNLVLARVLGPIDFASWTLGLVVISYAVWSHLSLLNAFRLEGARTLGRGDGERFLLLQRLAWTAAVLPAAILVATAIGVLVLVPMPGPVKAAVAMSAGLLVCYQVYAYAGSTLYAQERFALSARLQMVYAVSNLLLTLALALVFGFWGAVVAQALSFVVALWIVRNRVRLLVAPLINRQLLGQMLRIGVPLALNGVALTIFTTVDRTLVAGLLGVAALGQYALTSLARSSVGLLPVAIADVINMRAATEYGAGKSVAALIHITMSADRRLAFSFAGLIGVSMVWAPVAVALLLPRYASGLAALGLFLAGLFFTVPVLAGVFLQVTGRAAELLAINLGAAAIEVGLVIVGALVHGIEGVALGTAGASVLMYLTVNVWGLRRASVPWTDLGRQIGVCVLPFVCVVVILVAVGINLAGTGVHLSQSFLASALVLGVTAGMWRFGGLGGRTSSPMSNAS